VIMRPCPYCGGPLQTIRTEVICCAHHACKSCRMVFVFDGKKLVLCAKPKIHAPVWVDVGIADPVPLAAPLVLSGGMDRI
jgi:hypothetical protein